MRLDYVCSQCGSGIDEIFVQELDEIAFGFDCLNDAERQELLTFDPDSNTLTVKTLCDYCIAEMKLDLSAPTAKVHWLH
ncbi:hypothetical protein AXX12_01505 [Anaerosporomusa subterranea]|uniref:Anti-sigma-F factor Fin family protein n=1 Tax=Anaerosporomusa subterranea TaxID=1794912 RepID=A0A154BWI7_ANASB|nr:anti-sigma-F factor Fin [Anaerosporomusa subterranea]KYZ78245.1 hypothetical protein AXX12_01505 [Anaerosporomusa subterranea]